MVWYCSILFHFESVRSIANQRKKITIFYCFKFILQSFKLSLLTGLSELSCLLITTLIQNCKCHHMWECSKIYKDVFKIYGPVAENEETHGFITVHIFHTTDKFLLFHLAVRHVFTFLLLNTVMTNKKNQGQTNLRSSLNIRLTRSWDMLHNFTKEVVDNEKIYWYPPSQMLCVFKTFISPVLYERVFLSQNSCYICNICIRLRKNIIILS